MGPEWGQGECGAQIFLEWRYFAAKPIIDLSFPSLITRLYKQARVHRDAGNFIVGCERPFDPLRVEEAPGRGRKKRKSASAEKGDSGASTSRSLGPLERIETKMASWEGSLDLPPPAGLPPVGPPLVQQLQTPGRYRGRLPP